MNQERERNTQQPLDKKDVERIKKLSTEKIIALTAEAISRLTHNFDEGYARLIIEKGNDTEEQEELLRKVQSSFNCLYLEIDSAFNSIYLKEPPSYFAEWDYLIEVDGKINADDDMQPAKVEVALPPTISEMIAEGGKLNNWLANSINSLKSTLNSAKDEIKEMLERSEQLGEICNTGWAEELAEENNELRQQLESLREWKDTLAIWKTLLIDNAREHPYFQVDDPMNNPKYLLMEAIKIVHNGLENEKKLKEENEQLKMQQTEWRESEEYLEEKKKWEKAKNQRIEASKLRETFVKYAGIYKGDEQTLQHMVLYFAHELRGTAWQAVEGDLLNELIDVRNKAAAPSVMGDYVVHKHVENEVSNVENGGTGITTHKREK